MKHANIGSLQGRPLNKFVGRDNSSEISVKQNNMDGEV